MRASSSRNILTQYRQLLRELASIGFDCWRPDSWHIRRTQVCAAIGAVAEFLLKTGQFLLAEQFLEVGSALLDGADHPIFMRATGHARRDPQYLWYARANLALAIEALHAAGISPAQAAIKILREHPDIKQLGKSVNPDTILNWRREFRAGRVKNGIAREYFSQERETLRAHEHDLKYLDIAGHGDSQAAVDTARQLGTFTRLSPADLEWLGERISRIV